MEAVERPKAFEELGRQIQLFMKVIEAYKAKVTWTHFVNSATINCVSTVMI